MRTLPVALLEVGARVSDLFTTVLARHRDVLLFRHAACITECCLECIRVSTGGKRQLSVVRARLADQFQYLLKAGIASQSIEGRIVFDPPVLQLVASVWK